MPYACLLCGMAGGSGDAGPVTCIPLCVSKPEQDQARSLARDNRVWGRPVKPRALQGERGQVASGAFVSLPFVPGHGLGMGPAPHLCCQMLGCGTSRTVIPEAASPDPLPQLSVHLT